MKKLCWMGQRNLTTWISMVLTLTPFLFIGCAHFKSRSTSSARKPEHVISMDRGGDPLKALEQELTTVKSDRVIVSTVLLRSLVRNGRIQQNQCKNISGQLEALKNIDLEETGEALE